VAKWLQTPPMDLHAMQVLSLLVTVEEHWYHCTTRAFQKMRAKSATASRIIVASFLCPLNCLCHAGGQFFQLQCIQ
jgi:hypothetical protein